MVVPERASHWDYFHLLGSFEEQRKFNYAVKLYVLFVNEESDASTREYILTRVIQALGAMSNSMRAGAFSLFCTLLVNCPDRMDYDTVKKLINAHLKPAGNTKADAEAYVGQLLAYKALVQSNFLDQSPSQYHELAENLMELSAKKSYLHAESLRLLSQITAKTKLEFGSDEFVRHLKRLDQATLDKLHYLLKLDLNIEEPETSGYLFDGKRLLSPATAPEVGILLSKCQNPSHGFFGEFFEAIAENDKYVTKLWKTYEAQIENKLDTNKSVLEMYYTMMAEILQQLLNKKRFKPVAVIVSNVAVESLLKNAKSKPELTKKVCKCISEVLGEADDSALSLEILNRLVFNPGNFSFDEETGSRVVSSAWRSLAADDTKEFSGKCLEVVVKGQGAKNKDRLNALNMYCSLLNKPSKDDANTDWRVGGLKALLKAGLLDDENISAELATAIRKSFFNSLSTKFPTLPAYAEALKELVKCLNSCLKKKLKIKLSDEMKDAWERSQNLITNLGKSMRRVKEDKTILINALELVTCFTALKSIIEPKESQFNLTDLQSVLQRIKSDGGSEGPEWIEVVIDLFLSMLSKENASNRKIVNTVFRSMVAHMNDGAFMQLVDVLRPAYDLKSMEDVAEGSDEESESNEESSDESEEEAQEESDQEKCDTEEEEDGDTDDDDMDDEEMNSRAFNLEKLQFDLRKALTPADSDNESVNIDDLDEEQGRQLDATLSAIFKNAKIKKPKETKESVTTHFRTRVIDLLETYCLVGMPLDHWLTLIPALLELASNVVAAKNAGGLRRRLLSFVRRISSATIPGIGTEMFDPNPLVQLLQQLIQRAASASGAEQDLGQHYLELVKFCIRNTNHVHVSKLDSLKKSMEAFGTLVTDSFFSEKTSLQMDLMLYLCTSHWHGVHNMVNEAVQQALAPSTKNFRRVKGLELFSAYVKSDRLFSAMTEEDSKSIKKLLSSMLDSLIQLKSEGSFDVATVKAIAGLIINLHEWKCSPLVKWGKWKEQIPFLVSLNSLSGCKKLKPQLVNMCSKLGLNADDLVSSDNAPIKKQLPQQEQQVTPQITKKRKRVDARKLKKESKVRRLAAMDGLDDLSWSKLSAED